MFRAEPYPETPILMKDFDNSAHVKALKRELETIQDPRRRKILENSIEHAIAEGEGNYDRLMNSCSRKRQSYYFWGSAAGTVQNPVKSSYEELKAFYRAIIDSGAWNIHYDLDKIVVGDDAVVMDGVMHQIFPTAVVNAMMPYKLDETHQAYQMSKRLTVAFLFDEDGVSCGEHSYTNGPVSPNDFTPVDAQYVPASCKAKAA